MVRNKPIKTEGRQVLWRMGYPKYDIEEVWGNKGLIGANYWDKKTRSFVKSKKPKKGERTEW